MMLVEARISRLVICEFNTYHVVYLREKDGEREFPIVIAIYEATLLDRKLKGIPSERPLTHDVFVLAVETMGGKLESVEIYDKKDQTFFAYLNILKGEEKVRLDIRPSDAMIIALSTNPPLPIYVREEVIQEALHPKKTLS